VDKQDLVSSLLDGLPARPPSYWDPSARVAYDGAIEAWSVYAFRDVRHVINNRAAFSTDYGRSEEQRRQGNLIMGALLGTDGQVHRDLRAAAEGPFQPAALATLRAQARQTASELLDQVGSRGDRKLEVVADLATPLPSSMACSLLGVEISAAERMFRWHREFDNLAGTHEVPAQQDMKQFFEDLINQRRREPGPGFVNELITMQQAGYTFAGSPLSDYEIAAICAALLSAGTQSVTAGITNAFLFLTTAGLWEELALKPSLIPDAVEECLRWYPPFPAARRLACKDLKLGGRQIRAGQWVMAWITSANRDPGVFSSPNSFNIRRHPNRHLSFGAGRFHCIGAKLARTEICVMIEEAARRFPRLHRDQPCEISRDLGFNDSVRELPMLTV